MITCDEVSAVRILDLSEAMERLGHDEELLSQLISIYRQDAPRLMQRVAGGLAAGDLHSIRDAAHNLKGLAANFSASQVVLVAQFLENAAAEQDLGSCLVATPLLEAALKELGVALPQTVGAA